MCSLLLKIIRYLHMTRMTDLTNRALVTFQPSKDECSMNLLRQLPLGRHKTDCCTETSVIERLNV